MFNLGVQNICKLAVFVHKLPLFPAQIFSVPSIFPDCINPECREKLASNFGRCTVGKTKTLWQCCKCRRLWELYQLSTAFLLTANKMWQICRLSYYLFPIAAENYYFFFFFTKCIKGFQMIAIKSTHSHVTFLSNDLWSWGFPHRCLVLPALWALGTVTVPSTSLYLCWCTHERDKWELCTMLT